MHPCLQTQGHTGTAPAAGSQARLCMCDAHVEVLAPATNVHCQPIETHMRSLLQRAEQHIMHTSCSNPVPSGTTGIVTSSAAGLAGPLGTHGTQSRPVVLTGPSQPNHDVRACASHAAHYGCVAAEQCCTCYLLHTHQHTSV